MGKQKEAYERVAQMHEYDSEPYQYKAALSSVKQMSTSNGSTIVPLRLLNEA